MATEKMATRTYPIDQVLRVACALSQIAMPQLVTAERDPVWAYMARTAVIGVVFELCEVSQIELSEKLGVSRTTIMSQSNRFKNEWPRTIRRGWIEAVLCRLWGESVKFKYPEISHGSLTS